MTTDGPSNTDGSVAELRQALEELRATTGTEALELRSLLRAIDRRVAAIEESRPSGAEADDDETIERRRRIKAAKAKMTPEEIARIRQERARARGLDAGPARDASAS
jgi:hypothetical protein